MAVIGTALICGGIGFLDDYAKIRHKTNAGLSAKLRLGSETVIGALLGFVLVQFPGPHTGALYVFASHRLVPLPMPVFILLAAFLVAATTNALNLHDGMDGLAAGTSALVLTTLTVMLIMTGHLPLAIISATACGAILGFLAYNKNPAQIFMGDTGSLFIGGLIAALVIASGTVLYFIPLSLIYIGEAVSVMLQVSYFKLTKEYAPDRAMSAPALAIYKLTHRLPGEGKRLFRMAPLHHHFEAVLEEKGVKEWQLVAGFWAVQALLCLVVLVVFFALLRPLP
jgi:phospho-N-acetylmuramoyl-pentapeptide-transferase